MVLDGWLGILSWPRSASGSPAHDRTSVLLGPKNPTPEKLAPYECGMPAVGNARERHSVKFYLVAMIFLLFDIEIAFLYPWAMALRDLGWYGYFQILTFFLILVVGYVLVSAKVKLAVGVIVGLGLPGTGWSGPERRTGREVLEWNQVFIDMLIATNAENRTSQRLGAIVHTAIFDAYNGIERRYTPLFVHEDAPAGASRRAAVIAAAYGALVGLFSSQAAGAGRPAMRLRWRRLRDDCEHGGQSSPTSAVVRDAYRARRRLGNRGRSGRTRLARDRRLQHELPSVHR